jgi:hypothetical protein
VNKLLALSFIRQRGSRHPGARRWDTCAAVGRGCRGRVRSRGLYHYLMISGYAQKRLVWLYSGRERWQRERHNRTVCCCCCTLRVAFLARNPMYLEAMQCEQVVSGQGTGSRSVVAFKHKTAPHCPAVPEAKLASQEGTRRWELHAGPTHKQQQCMSNIKDGSHRHHHPCRQVPRCW